jgi:hypothetical protein
MEKVLVASESNKGSICLRSESIRPIEKASA